MDFSTFFDAFTSEDSLEFMIFNLIFFLFGFILAWILWGGRARKLRRELKAANDKAVAAEAQLISVNEQLEKSKNTNQELQSEAETAAANLQNLQLSFDRHRAQYQVMEEKNEQLQELVESYETNIEALNEQILGLRSRNTELAEELERGVPLAVSEQEVEGLAEMQSSYNATIKRLTSFENKLEKLSTDNEKLRLELEDLKAGGAPLELGAIAREENGEEGIASANEDKDAEKSMARLAVAAAIGGKIPKAKKKHKDDLKLINGIGPFIEDQLNDIGIYTFEQVAALDEDMIGHVTKAIGFFPGRIKRDDWVGQASRLADIKSDNPDALKTSAVFPNNPKDLKIVEGIGPKIEKILKKGDVNNWQDLANSDEGTLREMLLKAGDRYRMHNPATWPKQAQMAVDGEWEKLKEYQDYLKGGRE
ncbi:MAG: DUF1049 domain-containing protein [Bacteroidetes bacterium]|nr:DUF1049 domain-containing protein [Bacteroidota bacterium]